MPFRLVTGRPHVDITMVFGKESRHKVDALVDTGSWLPLMATGPLLEMTQKAPPYRWEFGREWFLEISSVAPYQPSNLAGPIDFDALLGYPALAPYKVIFDYPHNTAVTKSLDN